MKDLLKNTYVQIALAIVAVYILFELWAYFKRRLFVAQNLLSPQSAQGGVANQTVTTISPQKASEYAARIVDDVDSFSIWEWASAGIWQKDDEVYLEMMALTPQDIIEINNQYLKNFKYPYKTVAEFIRAKSSFLTDNQEKFLAKFDSVIK